MNLEGLEQFRYESTKQVMEAMTKVAVDTKAPLEDRFKAAKIVDGMSDSIIKVHIANSAMEEAGKQTKGLIKGIDKLIDKSE